MEDREAHLLAENRCGTEERDKKLLGCCCRSGLRRVLIFVMRKRRSLKVGNSCTWEVLIASVVNTFK